jgi:hypothetical protein
MTAIHRTACFLAFLAVAIVGLPISFVASVLAHIADWLDDLAGELLEGADR